MSDKTKLTWIKGSVIKQGDTSSEFKLKLRTENNDVLNGPATVQIIQGQSKIDYETEVVSNVISFRLPHAVPAGVYTVEVEHAGYVFPSSNSPILTVNENIGDYITDEVTELLSVDEYIKQKLADFQVDNIDLDELVSKIEIPHYDDTKIREQITDILSKIDDLKQSEINQTNYDDSEIKSRLTVLENKPDNDTVYDDTIINQRLTALEQSSGTGVETSKRYGPTGWFLDRSTVPWTIYFDNGCRLQLPDYPTSETIYGYGYSINPYNKESIIWPILSDILSYAHGSLKLETLKSVQGGADYWGDRSTVINPVQDASKIDFTNARFNNTDSTHYSEIRQRNKIRVFYELGLLSKSDILSLGATEI